MNQLICRYKSLLLLGAFFFAAAGCLQAQNQEDPRARAILDTCIKVYGGAQYQSFDVGFAFRKYEFRLQHRNGLFTYIRMGRDSANNFIRDRLDNQGFQREVNGVVQPLTPKQELRYREAVNSVAYFMLLPYKLKDPAAHIALVDTALLDGQPYYKLKVWFDAAGGGIDHEDVFCYWIHQRNHTLDYLAYANGGPRFRKVIRRDTVQGLIFQNYENYQILDAPSSAADYDKAFRAGKAKLLSIIEQSAYRRFE